MIWLDRNRGVFEDEGNPIYKLQTMDHIQFFISLWALMTKEFVGMPFSFISMD